MRWLPITNYEGLYEVSDTGLVRSIDRILPSTGQKDRLHKGREIKASQNKKVQYLQVSLWKNNKGKNHYVHRLVAQAFIPNPDNLTEVNHIDGNKLNNNLANLEWVSRSGNVRHAITTGLITYENKLTEDELLECLYGIIRGESYLTLSHSVPYNVPFLSTKVRQIAVKHNIEDELDCYLNNQKIRRIGQSTKTIREKYSKKIAMFSKDTGEYIQQFNSVKEAHNYINCSSAGSISNCALGRQKTAGGYIWKYI